jgi:hypothetical protein
VSFSEDLFTTAIPKLIVAKRRGIFQNTVFLMNVCVLFFQTSNKLLGQIVIKFFGPNYLIKGSVGYFFWPSGAVKKLLRH